jgi:uncharacterized membrane protein (Fun14 family)
MALDDGTKRDLFSLARPLVLGVAIVGGLLNAKMGVLQVNEEFSTAVSWEGNDDKTTLDKDVLAIVTASFALR